LLENTSETSANISFGDLDRDGHLDVVLAKGRHWPLVNRVVLLDGHGIRASHNLDTVADRSYTTALGDLDGDGDLDVVVGNDAPDPKRVYLNDGTGHFRLASTYGLPTWPTRNVTLADVNGDGRLDILVANRPDDAKDAVNYICLNKGGGHFDSNCLPLAHYPATTITTGDLNRDGFIDLVVPHRDDGQSYVYLGGPARSYSDARRIPFGPSDAEIRMAVAADLDGDGFLDVVAIDERKGVARYMGRPGQTFAVGVPIAGAERVPYALAVADLEDNGRPDLIVGHIDAPSTVYFAHPSDDQYTAINFGDSKGVVMGFAIGDLDRDGVLDIGVAKSGAPNVVYFGSR
jgi:hypothetical protein